MCVIKHSEIVQKKNTLLKDSLQKAERKHEETIQDETDSTLLETLRMKEEENKKLETQVADLIEDVKRFRNSTEVQEDLRKEVMCLKI